MNARELLDLYRKNGPHAAFTTHGARAIVESALSLLDAAERNDGKTPETDAAWGPCCREQQIGRLSDDRYALSSRLEQRCTGLAAEVVRLNKVLADVATLSGARATSTQRAINNVALDALHQSIAARAGK